MRDEAEAIVAEYGWTEVALQKMRKIDSFLKESQRLNCPGSCEYIQNLADNDPFIIYFYFWVLITRKTLQDWRLSDGTLIPAGTRVGVASGAMNKEEVETLHPPFFCEEVLR